MPGKPKSTASTFSKTAPTLGNLVIGDLPCFTESVKAQGEDLG